MKTKFTFFLGGIVRGMVFVGGTNAFFEFCRGENVPLLFQVIFSAAVLVYAWLYMDYMVVKRRIEDKDLEWETIVSKCLVALAKTVKELKDAEKTNRSASNREVRQ